MAFQGWFVKFGDYQLPNKFLKRYTDTSNQRIERDAYRDINSLLHRDTSPYLKSTVILEVMGLNLQEMNLLKDIIETGIINEVERKVAITYWNSEEMDYKTGEFYIPDITKRVPFVDEGTPDLRYEPFDLEMIEY